MTTLLEHIEEDLDTIFDTDSGFAIEVTFTGTSGPYAINAIFEEGVYSVNDFTGEKIFTPPRLAAKTKDLVDVKPHDKVKVGLVTYEVVTIDPDGSGVSRLRLNKTRDDG